MSLYCLEFESAGIRILLTHEGFWLYLAKTIVLILGVGDPYIPSAVSLIGGRVCMCPLATQSLCDVAAKPQLLSHIASMGQSLYEIEWLVI